MAAALASREHVTILASSEGLGWGWVTAEEVLHERADFRLPADPNHMLVMHLDRPMKAHETLGRRTGKLGPGSFVFLPAGEETSWRLEQERPAHHLHIELGSHDLAELADDVGVRQGGSLMTAVLGEWDPQLAGLAGSLLGELRRPALGGPLYGESLGLLIAVRLLRRAGTRVVEPAVPGRLSPRSLGELEAMVEAYMGEDLSLRRLAAGVHLSPYHFSRLFRSTTGESPHQFVIRRRIERARLLLSTSELSVSQIATSVGFTNPSHLAARFRRLTGATPSRYRRETAGSRHS